MAKEKRAVRAGAERRSAKSKPREPGPLRTPRRVWWALAAAALVLAALADDRHVGRVADGRQMIRTAVAIAESGSIGQARDTDFTLPRAVGDSVSRFGMGTSLLQVPAAWLAPRIEAVRGPASSQALFLLVPLLGVLVASLAAARVALHLGAGARAATLAALLVALGSPLGSYAAMEFSEPVQAACLAAGLAGALASAAREGRPALVSAAASGAAAGFAVLVKTSALAVAPWTLLPLLAAGGRSGRIRRVSAAAAGAAPFLALWAWFELARFGGLFGGYPDDRFTHALADGLWRLLIGPNRGLALYFPAVVVAALWTVRALRTATARARLAAAGAWTASLAMLAIAAGYWGWHGMEGWGPRLIVPAVALLAPLAAAWLAERPAWAGIAVTAVSAAVNLPGFVQHPTPVATYVMNCRWPEISLQEAPNFPFYARGETAAGAPTVVPFEVLEREPAASSFLVYPWFMAASRADGAERASRLASPPWRSARPEIVPAPELLESGTLAELVPPPRIGFLGRSIWTRGRDGHAAVYDEALADQVVRAQQLRDAGLALRLAEKLVRLAPEGESDALLLESLRLAGRRDMAAAHLRPLPLERRRHPKINVVLALFERDAGNEAGAKALLRTVAASFPGTPASSAVDRPLLEWPADLHGMTLAARRDSLVAAPSRP
jgi:hypothetical protein